MGRDRFLEPDLDPAWGADPEPGDVSDASGSDELHRALDEYHRAIIATERREGGLLDVAAGVKVEADARGKVLEMFEAQTRAVEALGALVDKARDAMIVLSDDTWRIHVEEPGRSDDDTLYAWSVGQYREMREVAAEIDVTLAALRDAETEEGEDGE